MKILIASDSFKDALPALAVCQAIERGLKLADAKTQTLLFPMADGGEGTAEILTYHSKGRSRNVVVKDPLFRPRSSTYGISGDGRTAFIEMAEASGLQLLSPEERNPMETTTFGTGELILDAIRRGVEKILLGIGGSATNDAGMGMAEALGFRFLSEAGEVLKPIGKNLPEVHSVDDFNLKFDKTKTRVEVLCDVNNPLFGKAGAAHIYARQKGAGEGQIEELDEGLKHFSGILKKHFQKDFSRVPGAGAAGGMGAGAMAFLGAKLRPGIEMVMEQTGFEKQLKQADLLITGEGKIDGQTLRGKLIHGIAQKAKKHHIPVVAFCGTMTAAPKHIEEIGLQAAFSILTKPESLAQAIRETGKGLEALAFNFGRAIQM